MSLQSRLEALAAAVGADIKALRNGTGTVSAVNGRTGAVTLAKSDVGLDQVDNTPDTLKPVSTPQQAAITSGVQAATWSFPDDRILDYAEPFPTGVVGIFLRRPQVTLQTIAFVGASFVSAAGTSSTTATSTIPTGTQAGDTMLGVWATNTVSASYNLPGWSLVTTLDDVVGATNIQLRLYTKVATSSDTPGTVVTATADANRQVLGISTYRGVGSVEAVAKAVSASSTAVHTTPALATVAANCVAISILALRSSSVPIETWTTPAGLTERGEAASTGSGGKGFVFADNGPTPVPAATQVGGKAFTQSVASAMVPMMTVVLKPVGA